MRGDVCLYLIGQTRCLQRAQRFVVNADGSGVVNNLRQLLCHDDAYASHPQSVCQCQPYRASANDQDIGIVLTRLVFLGAFIFSLRIG
jgi:hypothetical protein